MVDKKDAKDADGKEDLSEHMACICADSVSEKKQKKWVLENINEIGGLKIYVK